MRPTGRAKLRVGVLGALERSRRRRPDGYEKSHPRWPTKTLPAVVCAAQVQLANKLLSSRVRGRRRFGCWNLSIAHGSGRGVPKDAAQAFVFADRACTTGNRAGCIQTALAKVSGSGIAKDVQARIAQPLERIVDALGEDRSGVPRQALTLRDSRFANKVSTC
jgi:TPR repeat protein